MLRALLLVIVLGVPSLAQALPVVVGCCDSITNQPGYPRTYTTYLNTDPMNPDFQIVTDPAIPSQTTAQAVLTLQSYLSTNPADAVVIISGTPDTFFSPTGFGSQPYDQTTTVGNIQTMITDVINAGAVPILAAPPPVIDPCDNPNGGLTCTDINNRLTNLASALGSLAGTDAIPFVNLHSLYLAQSDLASLFQSDGVHPTPDVADPLIAGAIRPVLLSSLANVPEPGTLVLLATGLIGLAAAGRRSRRI